MTSGCYIDELEGQRRELEARRAMLEERFKLRLATAQEFGVIRTQRLGRVREAFVAQCGAAHRRNQRIIDRVRQSNDVFSEEGAFSGTSRKRLSHQMERFLSVADKLYPAWQEQQLQRKATMLGAIEEERFVTEQRRRVARQRFEQEQALATVVSDRRRRLAAARAHERNELALRQTHRDRSAAEDREALRVALERASEAGRAARHDVLAEISNNHHHHGRRLHGNHSRRGERGGGRERRYIPSDDEDEKEVGGGEREKQGEGVGVGFGLSGRPKGRRNRAGANRGADASSATSERRINEEGQTHPQERSGLVPGGGGGGRSGSSVDEQLGLQDVFCATRKSLPRAGEGRVESGMERPGRRGEQRRRGRHDGRRAEGADNSTSRSPSPATRNNGRREPPTTVNAKLTTNEARQNTKKSRDNARHRHRPWHRRGDPSDEDEQARSPSLPPPPSLADAHGGSNGEDRAGEGQRTAVERQASHSEEKKARAEVEQPPRPPPQEVGSLPPPGRRSRIRSFSSSNGSGGEVPPSGDVASSAVGSSEGRLGTLRKDGESAEAPIGLGDGGRRPAAARALSWSDEDDNNGATVVEAEETRTKVPASIFSLGADLDEGGHVVGGGGGGDKAEDSASPASLPVATRPDERPGKLLSLPAAARAVAVLTAQIERLAQASAPAAGRNPPAASLVLEAYRSVAAERHDATARGTEMTAAVAAVAAVAAAAAATIPADDTHSSLTPELEAFGMAAQCGAVLDLITTYATELLPPEALSGIVTAAKVRAQHRRGGKAGRLQLFDAVTGHARRLCAAATEATAEGERSSGGAVDSAAIAAVFVTCFEAVITAEEARGNGTENRAASNARGAERLRRKVLALLESAADPNGASTKTRQIPPTEVVAALPALVAAGPGASGGEGAECDKPTDNTVASDHAVDPKGQRQQGRRGSSSTTAVAASSGGVVLGGGRRVGGRKKKGGRLDLSSFGGSMAVFGTAGHGGSLPEFDSYEALEG